MNSFSQADVSKRCNVTRATVNRWVELAKEKKNNLQLDFSNKIVRILDSPHNDVELNRLAKEAKKYRNSIPVKEVAVSEEFYEYFNEEEIVEIITDLEFNREVNLKFAYRNGGANNWDGFYKSNVSPIKSAVNHFINQIETSISYLAGENKQLNLIDIGPGNGEPVIELISNMIKKGVLKRYIPIDISNEIIHIVEKSIKNKFPLLDLKSYQADLENARFKKIFLENKLSEDNASNFIIFLGNTIANIIDKVQTLKNIRKGMIEDDMLAVTFSLDNEINKSNLNYVKTNDADQMHSFILEKMGVDISRCDLLVEYNEQDKCKTKSIILDKDYAIHFNLFGQNKTVFLEKDEPIIVWRHYLSSMEDFVSNLDEVGFEVLVTRKSNDLANGLVICQIKTNE